MKGVINKRNIFYPFLVFLFGLGVARDLFCGKIDVIVITLIVLLVTTAYLIATKCYKSIAVLLLLFVFGNGIYFIAETNYKSNVYQGQVSIVGRVTDKIYEGNYNSFTVVLDDVKINGNKEKKMRLTIKNCLANPKAGQILTFESECTPSKLYELGKFNSSDYRNGVRYSSEVDWKNVVAIDGKVRFDEKIRLRIKDVIYNNMNERNAGLAYAVLFGDQSGVDWETKTTYQDAGIVHVLTVSGLHIGFLVTLLYFVLRKLRVNKYVRFGIITILIIFYSYLCGFTPSVLRAGIMAIVFMLASITGREYDGLNSLGLAGFIICLTRPLMSHDLGFLMSFFCVFAIYMLVSPISRMLRKALPKSIADVIAVSISAQIGVTPFLALYGASVNLLSFAINIIVVPLLSILYPMLFVISMVAAIIPFVGKLLFVVNIAFIVINEIAIFFGNAGLTFTISSAHFGLLVLLFVIIFGLSGYIMIEPIKKLAMFSCMSMLFAIVLGCYIIPTEVYTKLAYISSGSQYSLILSTKHGFNVVLGKSDLLEDYKDTYKMERYHVYISLDGGLTDEDLDEMSTFGFMNFISYASQDETVVNNMGINEIIYMQTEWETVTVEYLGLGNIVAGILLKFDNQTIFVANNKNFGYNLIDALFFQYEKPDVIFTDHYDNFSKFEGVLISNEAGYGEDYSLRTDGNLMLTLKNDKLKVRGID